MLNLFYNEYITLFWFLQIIPYIIVFIFVILSKIIGDFDNISKKYTDNEAFMRAVVIVWILGFIGVCIIEKFGSENLNSFWVKRCIKFSGYVFAFPNAKYDKNYRLRADMEKVANRYYVNRIYFYNGGYIDFEPDEQEDILDNKGSMSCNETWCFRFYGEEAKK